MPFLSGIGLRWILLMLSDGLSDENRLGWVRASFGLL